MIAILEIVRLVLALDNQDEIILNIQRPFTMLYTALPGSILRVLCSESSFSADPAGLLTLLWNLESLSSAMAVSST
jgi:hypothetical protein